jgi:hypothetical protein
MRLPHETIIGVFTGIQSTHPIQFVEEQRVDEMIDGEGIIGVAFDNFFKVPNRLVIFKVVKRIEGFVV